ncbi:MAG TPA: alpha/beta fold hydrolase [Acidimicrobiales bacterium]|nr:alpha/beta fold hydrolase [Acidimicrobiales bacterium]
MAEALWIGRSSAATDRDDHALWELRTVRANAGGTGVSTMGLDGPGPRVPLTDNSLWESGANGLVDGPGAYLGGAPLWEPRPDWQAPSLADALPWEPETKTPTSTMQLGDSPLWEPLTNGRPGVGVTDLESAPLWEPNVDVATEGPGLFLDGVSLPFVEERAPDASGVADASASGGLSLASVGRLAVRTYLGARRAAGDPRLTGVLRAAPSVASFIARSRTRSAEAAIDDTVVPVRTTPVLALQAYLDEVLIAVLRHPELLPKESDCTSAAADLERLRALFAREGWIDRPAEYHRDPPPPYDIETWEEHRSGMGYERAAFSSGWEPHPLEPGWTRWMAHEANQTVHAWVSRVPGRHHRSWLVCAHGLGMGNNPAMDLRAFRASQLGRRGINVVVPVLPLHGPRATGRSRGEDLMTIDMVDSMHGVAQAAWDVRRIIRWLREEQGAEQVGVIGYSLGGLVASIVAALEDDLACVIAGIPVVDLPHLVRRHSPPDIARLAGTSGVLGPAADDVHRVVSPLAMDCRVPLERRFIFAGLADRMSTFGHARRLWLHWDRPAFESYPGGHVGFFWSAAVKRFVDEALRRSYTNAAAA